MSSNPRVRLFAGTESFHWRTLQQRVHRVSSARITRDFSFCSPGSIAIGFHYSKPPPRKWKQTLPLPLCKRSDYRNRPVCRSGTWFRMQPLEARKNSTTVPPNNSSKLGDGSRTTAAPSGRRGEARKELKAALSIGNERAAAEDKRLYPGDSSLLRATSGSIVIHSPVVETLLPTFLSPGLSVKTTAICRSSRRYES